MREEPRQRGGARPGQATSTVRDPSQVARRMVTQARPGRAVRGDPGQAAHDRSGFFFFFFFFFGFSDMFWFFFFFLSGFSDMFWTGLLSESLDSFIFLCISDCTRDLRLNFFGL